MLQSNSEQVLEIDYVKAKHLIDVAIERLIGSYSKYNVTCVAELPDHRRRLVQFLEVAVEQLDKMTSNDFKRMTPKVNFDVQPHHVTGFQEHALKGFVFAIIKIINSKNSVLHKNLSLIISNEQKLPEVKDLAGHRDMHRKIRACANEAGCFFRYVTHSNSLTKPYNVEEPFLKIEGYDYDEIADTLGDISKYHRREFDNFERQIGKLGKLEAQAKEPRSTNTSHSGSWSITSMFGKKSKHEKVEPLAASALDNKKPINLSVTAAELDFSESPSPRS